MLSIRVLGWDDFYSVVKNKRGDVFE